MVGDRSSRTECVRFFYMKDKEKGKESKGRENRIAF